MRGRGALCVEGVRELCAWKGCGWGEDFKND